MLLPNVLAAQKAREAGAIDAILVRDGFALEATKANLFLVSKGRILRTAPNGPRILPGVTRGAVIEAARRIGLTVEERAFRVEEMYSAQEVFLASTTLWTYPLVEVEGRPVGGGKGGRRDADDPRGALRGVSQPGAGLPRIARLDRRRRFLRATKTCP